MVTLFEPCQIQIEVFRRERAFSGVPAIGQQDTTHIKENHVEGEHRRLSLCVAQMNRPNEFLMKCETAA
jgi:hypothetical protein